MFVGIGLKGLEEGRRGVYEEHALPPACRHREQDREGGWERGKGVEGESVLSRVGRVSAGAIPFPSGQLPTGARACLFTASITLNYSTTPIHTPSSPARRLRHRGLIIKYFLDHRIAAPTVSLGP
jgi:hypothetical protein